MKMGEAMCSDRRSDIYDETDAAAGTEPVAIPRGGRGPSGM
jgi:hypothetical protein